MHRGRRSVAIDLKHPDAAEVLLRLVERADALIEGFRPGVMERLGVGPELCLARNPKLAYGRMTGWGQDGPLAQAAGHDINYIALAGALRNFVRPPDRPVAPLNLVGDFGGGGMLLAFGLLCAIHEAARSGCGQVVDAAMVDGTAVLTTMFHGLRAQGLWYDVPGTNWADSGAPYYEVFETADGEYVTVGALERPFYDELVDRLGLDATDLPSRGDEANWPELKQRFAEVFRTRTRERVVRAAGGNRRLFRAGALLCRSARASPERRAQHVRRPPWTGATRAGAALRTHAGGALASPAPSG